MKSDRQLVSLVVPVFNEEKNIDSFYRRVLTAIEPLVPNFDFEFIFTDNHSTDQSFGILNQLSAKDKRIRIVRFSKNFGYQASIYTAYSYCRGDVAIQLDCDLQDPPELIQAFLEKWGEGFHVVYGIRRSRKEGFLMNATRRIFYRLIHKLSEDPLPPDAGDFRLVDRVILEELKKIRDVNPYLRGTIASLGFNQIGIPYDRDSRQHGKSKFSVSNLFGLALDGILNHSILPLRIATFIGLAISLAMVLIMLIYASGRLFFDTQWPAGFATTTILLLLSIALNGIFLGIIGEYLGRIYRQVKARPLVIIEKVVNVTQEQ